MDVAYIASSGKAVSDIRRLFFSAFVGGVTMFHILSTTESFSHFPVNLTPRSFTMARFMTPSTIADIAKEKSLDASSQRSGTVESFKVMDVLRRANQLEEDGRTIYHCEVGQPESGAPENVSGAAADALKSGAVMGYTDAFGLPELRRRIAGHYLDKYGVSVPINRIVITTGSSGGFLLTFTSCFDVGDVVAVASSGYPCYRNILGALGCKLANVPISKNFKLTAVELTAEIERRKSDGEVPLKGLILSSPSNPTGAMLSPEELAELCRVCDANDIRFLSDEIYHGISYGSVSEATALSYSKSAVVINSFSKYYSMSGWRLGWMVVPDALVPAINALQQNMFICAPGISQTAALRCWDGDTLDELEKHVNKYRASREILLKELTPIFSSMAPADGGFYIYVDLGEDAVHLSSGHGSVKFCQDFLEEEGVAFTPGVDFEDPSSDLGERRIRISYAGGVETVKRAMERFHHFWPIWTARVQEARSS